MATAVAGTGEWVGGIVVKVCVGCDASVAVGADANANGVSVGAGSVGAGVQG